MTIQHLLPMDTAPEAVRTPDYCNGWAVTVRYAMPPRAWTEFLDAYYRPHLLVVNVGLLADATARRQRANLVRRLIEALPLTGDYAITRQANEVRIAFERDSDIGLAKGLLSARRVKPGDAQWASKVICNFRLSS